MVNKEIVALETRVSKIEKDTEAILNKLHDYLVSELIGMAETIKQSVDCACVEVKSSCGDIETRYEGRLDAIRERIDASDKLIETLAARIERVEKKMEGFQSAVSMQIRRSREVNE